KSLGGVVSKAIESLPPSALKKTHTTVDKLDPKAMVDFIAEKLKTTFGEKAANQFREILKGNPKAAMDGLDKGSKIVGDVVDSVKKNLDPKAAKQVQEQKDAMVNPAIDKAKQVLSMSIGLPLMIKGVLSSMKALSEKAATSADSKIENPELKELAKTLADKSSELAEALEGHLTTDEDPLSQLFKAMGVDPEELQKALKNPPSFGGAEPPSAKELEEQLKKMMEMFNPPDKK
ncbi:MAG: hypothetical protein K2X66_18285, partial [Cyanobacteria bacterium]|nr:hypothetical protein [Cyanobacteriota bacterium]